MHERMTQRERDSKASRANRVSICRYIVMPKHTMMMMIKKEETLRKIKRSGKPSCGCDL